MYLRNEYATITEYNEQAGSVAEKYHFLVIAGLPAGFSESAMARLKSIVMSGARCGVFHAHSLGPPAGAARRTRAG
jgi:S-DNA-T family DNA segregation ATPase FtsK/SpoIIIE